MKSKNKWFGIMLPLVLLIGLGFIACTRDDFIVTIMADGNSVEITSYRGSSQTVDIPSYLQGMPVVSIGARAFSNRGLISINIPDSVTYIGEWAFNNNQLTSVTIPDSVTSIGESAFAWNQLTSVVIPDSVTYIGMQAFVYNQLTSVTIPNSVTSIVRAAFARNQLTSVVIPNSVTTIGRAAFQSNQLTSVVIPNSVTTIGEGAFYNNQLTRVTIPNSVTSIGVQAFYNNRLTNVAVPNSATTIGRNAFANNPLRSPCPTVQREIERTTGVRLIEYSTGWQNISSFGQTLFRPGMDLRFQNITNTTLPTRDEGAFGITTTNTIRIRVVFLDTARNEIHGTGSTFLVGFGDSLPAGFSKRIFVNSDVGFTRAFANWEFYRLPAITANIYINDRFYRAIDIRRGLRRSI